MLRRRSTRLTLAGGAAAAASLAIVAGGPVASAASGGAFVPHFDASDTNVAAASISPPLPAASGTGSVAIVTVTNPSKYLTLNLDNDFVVSAYNAAGQVIGTASPASGNLSESDFYIAPGGTGALTASFTVSGIDHFGVTNNDGALSTFLPEPFETVGNYTRTHDSGSSFDDITGTIKNDNALPAGAHLIFIALNSAGTPIGEDATYVDNVAAGATATYEETFPLTQGQPEPTSYQVLVQGNPFEGTNQSNLSSVVPFDGGTPYTGTTITLHPKVYVNNAPAAGKTIEMFSRTPGQQPQLVGSGASGADGTTSIQFKIPGPVDIFFEFPGDAATFGSTTGDLFYQGGTAPGVTGSIGGIPKLTLNKFTKKVKHKTVNETFKHGSTVAFTGTYKNPGGEKVQLQEFYNKHWHTVKTSGPIHGSGAFTIHLKAPSKKGTNEFRVFVPGNILHQQGTSSAIKLVTT